MRKRERHKYYKLALKEDLCYNGVCHVLATLVNKNGGNTNVFSLTELFPEFAKKKPKNCDSAFWWPLKNRSIRVKILNKCIAETSPIKRK